MNILKKIPLYISAVSLLMISGLFFVPAHKTEAAASCLTVTNAYFEAVSLTSASTGNGILEFNYPGTPSPKVKAVVETSGCVDQRIEIAIQEGTITPTDINALEDKEYIVPASGKVELTFKPSEEDCTSIIGTGYDCQHRIVVMRDGEKIYDSSLKSVAGATKGYVLNYDCDGACLAGDWVLLSKNAEQVSATCEITQAGWYSKLGPTPIDIRQAEDAGLELLISTSGCKGWEFEIKLENKPLSGTAIANSDALKGATVRFNFKSTGTSTEVMAIAGEAACLPGAPNCNIWTTIKTYDKNNSGSTFTSIRPISYNCKIVSKCDSSTVEGQWRFGTPLPGTDTGINAKTAVGVGGSPAGCEVTGATFKPYNTPGQMNNDSWSIFQGGYSPGWFSEKTRELATYLVTLTITTKDCAGATIGVELHSTNTTETVGVLQGRLFTVPESNKFEIKLAAGEETCVVSTDADCKMFILAVASNIYSSKDKSQGQINYECDGSCTTEVFWKYAGDTSEKPYLSEPLSTEQPTQLEDNGAGSASPDCIGTDGKAIDGCYQLYSGFAQLLKGKFSSMNSLGDFINAIIALAVGIAGIAAVLMIMWDGFTYWRSGKEGNEAKLGAVKGRIWKRLLGLLLLLSIYTLLRTINPDLLNLTPRIDAVTLQAAVDAYEQETGEKVTVKDFTKYIKEVYIPARDKALPNATKGIKALLTAQATQEGFIGGDKPSKSFRTKNPGNIGNTDDGSTVTYNTFEEGILAQNTYITRIINGQHTHYKIGTYYSDVGFTYNGTLDQYLKIYATGARKSDAYVNFVIASFAAQNIKITKNTLMTEIAAIN